MAQDTASNKIKPKHRYNPIAVTIASLLMVSLLGMVDFGLGYEISTSIFYLLPVSIIAWHVGRQAGLAFALLSAGVWLLADAMSGHVFSHALMPWWNALVRLGFFVVVVVMLSRLRRSYHAQQVLIAQLQEALDSVKVLSGLLPMCAWCKNVRDDDGYWLQVENYVTQRTEATFTHSICPACREKLKDAE